MPSPINPTDLSRIRSTIPVFPPAHDLEIVPLGTWTNPAPDSVRRTHELLNTQGFVLIHADPTPDETSPEHLAAALGLGPIFIPPRYRHHSYLTASGVTQIGTKADTTSHPAFGTTTEQPLHSDGTLQRIGEVKTAMLLCVRPAADGGASHLFNATSAFAELLSNDPAAAATLTAPHVLIRTSTLPGFQGQFADGPAFAVIEGRLISRYSLTSTDLYDPAAVADPTALTRALDFMEQLACPGSPYYLEHTLAAGQGLLLANDLISHGRAAYTDDPAQPRLLLRALFTQRRPAHSKDNMTTAKD